MATATAEPLLSAREVADRLAVSLHTVRRWTAEGRLPSVRFVERGTVRYRGADVEALIEAAGRPR